MCVRQYVGRSKSGRRVNDPTISCTEWKRLTRYVRSSPSRSASKYHTLDLQTRLYGASVRSAILPSKFSYCALIILSSYTARWISSQKGEIEVSCHHHVGSIIRRWRIWSAVEWWVLGRAANSLSKRRSPATPKPTSRKASLLWATNRLCTSRVFKPVRVVRYASASITPPPCPPSL